MSLRSLFWSPDRVAKEGFQSRLASLIAHHRASTPRLGWPDLIGPYAAYGFYRAARDSAAKDVRDRWRRESLGNAWSLVDPGAFNGWALKLTAEQTHWPLAVLAELAFRSEHKEVGPSDLHRLDDRTYAGEGQVVAHELVDAYYERFPDLNRPAGI